MKNIGRVLGWVSFMCALGAATGCVASVDELEDTSTTDEAIIGGSNATYGGHPWMVHIYLNQQNPSGSCAGILLKADWVLTAAHCMTGAQPANIFMYVGDYDISQWADQGTAEQGRFANEIHVHPSFGLVNGQPDHDLALLKIDPVSLSAVVKPIALKTTAVGSSGTAIAAGWGATAVLNPQIEGTDSSNILKRVDLPIRPNSTCNSVFSSIRNLASDELCAGYSGGTSGTCKGDSGGPLIQNDNGTYRLIGVTSWGNNYCASYGVFSRVSTHLSWIRSHVPGV